MPPTCHLHHTSSKVCVSEEYSRLPPFPVYPRFQEVTTNGVPYTSGFPYRATNACDRDKRLDLYKVRKMCVLKNIYE